MTNTIPLYVGIVGHEAAKFTRDTEKAAREIIRYLLSPANAVLVSGHCAYGGVDIFAEQEAVRLGRDKVIFAPKVESWEGARDGHSGYRWRNLEIANLSETVHCIVVREYPVHYTGMRFDYCYHCHTNQHIKSGGCWTAKRARHAEWWEL